MNRCLDDVVVITGAASGLGEAMARRFVEEGAVVVIADIQDDAGVALADQLGEAASYRHCDVTDEADVEALVDHAVATHGHLDVMVNNAGIVGARGPIATTPTVEFDATIDVLLRGTFLGM